MMDFRFNFKKYFGKATFDRNVQESCPIMDNNGRFLLSILKFENKKLKSSVEMLQYGEPVDVSSADKMWRYPLVTVQKSFKSFTYFSLLKALKT